MGILARCVKRELADQNAVKTTFSAKYDPPLLFASFPGVRKVPLKTVL
jgi:hypothetical protein